MSRKNRGAIGAEKEVAASARRYAPSIPTCLASRKQKRFTNEPSRHGRMRKCEGMSKAAMKVMRVHTEMYVLYEHLDVQIYTHI